MNDWMQQALALAIVTAAIGYLVCQAWKAFRARPNNGCGGCAKCTHPETLVAIQPLARNGNELPRTTDHYGSASRLR